MSALSILTCNYNTPDLTKNMIRSLSKSSRFTLERVYVMDTSPECGTLHQHLMADTIIEDLPNYTHGAAVNYGLQFIENDHILLIDSDVIFYKDIRPIYEKFKEGEFTLLGNVSGDRGGKSLHPRVDPWFCFINNRHLKDHGIVFFDSDRTIKSRSSNRVYDVGSTMFEDVIGADLKIANFNAENKYFKHYEGMSWRVQKYNPNDTDTDIDVGGTHNNKSMYEYGLQVKQIYDNDIKHFNLAE